MLLRTVKSGTPFLPVSDAQQLKVGEPAGTGVGRQETWGPVHKTTLNLVNLSIAMVDAGAAGAHGSQKVYDAPEGAIQILGAMYNLTTLAGAGGITDTAALVGALGSVAVVNDNATLLTTEADIIPSTVGTLVGGAGVLKKTSAAPAAAFDGTTTPLDIILNLAVPDAGSSANDTIVVNGTITLFWINLGDF